MEFDDLYQEIILDHSRHPHNFGEIAGCSAQVELDNPVCGDNIQLTLLVSDDGMVEDVQFSGSGCAISMASSSMMTDLVQGKPVADVREMIQSVQKAMRGETNADNLDELGDLTALKGVIKFPVRVKCATLGWHALEDALVLAENKK
ncbi:SUF system NifU family Fe-S cluster assembly protein [bacterium]|nr:SUF system NifU family Fe-S cluster assembly protein [bacterium]